MMEDALVNTSTVLQLARGDRERAVLYVNAFLNGVEPQLTLLRESEVNRDFAQIKRTAHNLKSQARYMGMSSVASHLERLEQLAAEEGWPDGLSEGTHEAIAMMEKAIGELRQFAES